MLGCLSGALVLPDQRQSDALHPNSPRPAPILSANKVGNRVQISVPYQGSPTYFVDETANSYSAADLGKKPYPVRVRYKDLNSRKLKSLLIARNHTFSGNGSWYIFCEKNLPYTRACFAGPRLFFPLVRQDWNLESISIALGCFADNST